MRPWELPDDPADARGVLLHWASIERGSYGYLMEVSLAVDPVIFTAIQKEGTIRIRLIVPSDKAGGLAIYGATMGVYPVPPTLIMEF
ncbi:MAG: hypothetical protein C4336_08005 [Armatimonadota bacterium]